MRAYQEHERGKEEEPKVVSSPVCERGLFEHAAITHAVVVVTGWQCETTIRSVKTVFFALDDGGRNVCATYKKKRWKTKSNDIEPK